jgi:cold shock CspA family protein
MRGTVKAYSKDVNAGVIKGDDGNQYGFTKSEWGGDESPAANESVNFDGAYRKASNVSTKT